jgi:hypothetical protein
VTTTQTATVTATVNGVSSSATITVTPSSGSTFTPILVNAGGPAYVDSTGRTWSADTGVVGTGYSAGYTWTATNQISGTADPALYQSCRYAENFTYQFPVPNGSYTVTLKFAEVSYASANQRVFHVSLNGTRVLTNFDIVAAAGGEYIAVDKSFTVNATNGQITIQFLEGNNWPMVDAIEIETFGTVQVSSTPAPPPPASGFTPVLVNAGGPAYVDSKGRTWSADTGVVGTGYSAGYTWTATNQISGTPDPALYQTCRYAENFTYQFSVPNGSYTVVLKFAEVSYASANQRVFNVNLNGTKVLTNFDIVAAAGGEYIAVDRSFTVNATNGQITIQFLEGNNWPMVDGIEIVSAGTAP